MLSQKELFLYICLTKGGYTIQHSQPASTGVQMTKLSACTQVIKNNSITQKLLQKFICKSRHTPFYATYLNARDGWTHMKRKLKFK